MTTDARVDTPIGSDDQGLLARVGRCCEPGSWARSRAWLVQAGRLRGSAAQGDVAPEDWARWLLTARPSLQASAQGLVRAMARQVWRLEVGDQTGKASSAQLQAAIRVGGQRWLVGLVAEPQLQVVALSRDGKGAA